MFKCSGLFYLRRDAAGGNGRDLVDGDQRAIFTACLAQDGLQRATWTLGHARDDELAKLVASATQPMRVQASVVVTPSQSS